MFQPELLRQKANRVLRRHWLKYTLRNVSNNDNHAGLERIYMMPDPWNLDSPKEHARFAATNGVIQRNFGTVGDILEIGSGEGLQSTYLHKVCRNLHGIEVSPTAVARARKRLPDAHFEAGDLAQQDWLKQGRRFDLVVACEVLYYVADLDATLEQMNQLGDACLVSFFSAEAHKLVGTLERIPNLQKDWFCFDGVTWLMAWWKNPPRAAGRTADTATPAAAT
jgi:2-polyprenyl-3-methyl-5-hydroxy-6-metoxy-1,4-benzoquinol methylase